MYFLASSIISGWDLGNYVLVSVCIELLRVVITLEQYIMWQLGYDTHPIFQLENLSFFSFFHYTDLDCCSFAAFVTEMLKYY